MTVTTTTNKVSFSANGSTTVFAYNFKIFADADLTVIIRAADGTETTKTLTTHYTVSGAGSSSGGNVTFTSGNTPANGETVVIKRELDVTQSTDYVANDPFPAASHEDALDRLTMIAQQQTEQIGRSIVFPDTDTAATAIPNSVTRANKFLGFGSSGEVAVLSSTGTAPGSIDTGNLVDSAVTSAKIADGTIQTGDIADAQITSAKIADGAVATADIANDAVTADKIADNAVVQAAIADNAVGTNQIANSAVTAAKLGSDVQLIPAGTIFPTARAHTNLPSGYLLCDGSSQLQSDYPLLFQAIGTIYGSGSGSNTFSLPDLRGRVVAGKDDMGGSAAGVITSSQSNSDDAISGTTLGDKGGDEVQDLQETHLPSHTHTVNSVTVFGWRGGGSGDGSQNAAGLQYAAVSNQGGATFKQATTNAVTTGTGTGTHTASLANTGNGTAVNNMQPTIILNYIIKT